MIPGFDSRPIVHKIEFQLISTFRVLDLVIGLKSVFLETTSLNIEETFLQKRILILQISNRLSENTHLKVFLMQEKN